VLLYGARSPDTLLYRRDLKRWSASPRLELHITVDYAAAPWDGNVGVVSDLLGHLALDPDNSAALLCGPEVMMRFSATALREKGLPREAIWLSMERNMKCAVGFCGHCQFGPDVVCKDGPVFRYDRIRDRLFCREI
jgi:NAD(P)H-flavin reductase